MSERIWWVLIGGALLAAGLAAWAAGVAYVARDTTRRGVGGWRRLWWLAVSLVPMVGLTAYVVAAARPPRGVPEPLRAALRRRETLPLRPTDLPRTPTMPVSALRPVAPEPAPAPRPRRDMTGIPQYAPIGLYVVDGPHAGQEFVVHALPAQIGRGAEATIRLDADLGVSRRHAELYRQAGVLRLRDLNSTHGTEVNGFAVTDKGLAPGDRIRVGQTLLAFRQGAVE
jgi:hypothetical protein